MPLKLTAVLGEVEGESDRVMDEEVVLVKGCVVPMALLVGLVAMVRVTPERLAAGDGLPEGLTDSAALPVRDTLGEPVSVAERHRVAEPEEVRHTVGESVAMGVTVAVRLGEGLME